MSGTASPVVLAQGDDLSISHTIDGSTTTSVVMVTTADVTNDGVYVCVGENYLVRSIERTSTPATLTVQCEFEIFTVNFSSMCVYQVIAGTVVGADVMALRQTICQMLAHDYSSILMCTLLSCFPLLLTLCNATIWDTN